MPEKETSPPKRELTPFERMVDFTRRIVRVPKSELPDKRKPKRKRP
jgi:hypothetical protein